LIYLDHAATSWPKPPEGAQAVAEALLGLTANAGRSGHGPSLDSARLGFRVRSRMAELLGAGAAENVVFVRGSTEGLNLVLKGWLKPGDRVAVSPLEHNSVMRPLGRLASQCGVAIETLPADPLGRIDADATRRLARQRPFALAAVAHASNVNGAVQDLAAVRDALGETPLLVDGAQAAGVLPIDLAAGRIDFFACSVHKGLLGPTGVGVCCLAPQYDLPPLCEGGTGSQSDSFEHPAFRPARYEAGTLNLHGLAGTAAALDGLPGRGLRGPLQRQWTAMLLAGLDRCPGVRVHSPQDGSALGLAITVEGLRPDQVALRLERNYGILCRPGLQCAPAAHRHLGTFPQGAVRLSPGWGNTEEEMEQAVKAVREIAGCGM